jgi:hypothetical protein
MSDGNLNKKIKIMKIPLDKRGISDYNNIVTICG